VRPYIFHRHFFHTFHAETQHLPYSNHIKPHIRQTGISILFGSGASAMHRSHSVSSTFPLAARFCMMRRSFAHSDSRLRYRLYDRQRDNGHYDKCEWNMIQPGDFKEGLRAAAAIGNDRWQKLSRSHIQPGSWPHDSFEQRMTWLKLGLESESLSACTAFGASRL